MIPNQFDFERICIDSIFCSNELCQLDHQRVFVGFCIKYLRMEQQFLNQGGNSDDFEKKKCDNKDCKLYHFGFEKFKDQIQKQTVNGVFQHNLCPSSCNEQNCKFLYREWAKNACLDYIVRVCRKEKGCKQNHVSWDQLKDKAKAQSIIQTTTPELICEKEKCNCSQHPAFLQDYCIYNLKGWCPRKKCIKNHIDWEKINFKIGQGNALKSCIAHAEEKRKKQNLIPNGDDIKLFCDSQEFTNYKKQLLQQNIIDVVFIMDLTGSMQPWKQLMEQTIAKIINQFQQSVNGYQIRMAFVGYRDVNDQDKNVFWSFTKKIEDIQKFISKLETKGGGDEAEDVVSGFEQALKLNFSHHPESLLCTFLLADAPCHGRDYHNIESDDLKDKMPKNYFEKVLEKYSQIKKNNFLCCVKINNRTDIMFNKMKAVFPLITITTEKKPEQLGELVGFTLRNSVTESIRLKEQKNNQFTYIQATYQKLKLDVSVDNFKPNRDYWKQYTIMIDSLTRTDVTGLKITNDNAQLNKDNNNSESNTDSSNNSSTYIFKAFDAINNREVILKLPKDLVDNQGNISNQQITNAEDQAMLRFYSSAYACQMAYFYNEKLKDKNLLNEMQPIFYAHPILYTLENPFYGVKLIYGETFINIKYKFEKYTNNDKYFNPEKYFFTSFSHFTYHYSEKLFVITDLQGCNNILSDPSIQTDSSWDTILKNDLTNQKDRGIVVFEEIQHKNCSYLCKALDLQKLPKNTQINEVKYPKQYLQNICGICYQCDEFVNQDNEMTDQGMNKRYEGQKFQFKCDFCINEAKNPVRQECQCCDKIFITPNINQLLKNLTNLNKCLDCKEICEKQNNNSCQYCKIKCQKLIKKLTINNEIKYICENAYQYLLALRCQKCKKPYDTKTNINIDDYEKGYFTCC